MLEVLKFIFRCIARLLSMLFNIDLGFTNLGVLLCVIVFFFPLVLGVINILKYKVRGD